MWYSTYEVMKKMRRRLLGITQAILIGLVILSGAIAIPILFRPFFYWHIAPLGLTDMVELTTEQIKTTYREVMNFCIGLTDTFSAGVLPFSASGADHFADVRKLFLLDLWVLVVAGILLIVIISVTHKEKLRLLGHPWFLERRRFGVGICNHRLLGGAGF